MGFKDRLGGLFGAGASLIPIIIHMGSAMSEDKNDYRSIAWLVAKCGITTLLGLTLILLFYFYPQEIEALGAVAVVGISGFFGTVFGLIGRGTQFIGLVPWLAVLGLTSLYAWGLCVAIKLKRRKETCNGYHYLEIAIHKLAVLIWLIAIIKTSVIDFFSMGMAFIIGGVICLIHWCASHDSAKVLDRRKKFKKIRAARLGKR